MKRLPALTALIILLAASAPAAHGLTFLIDTWVDVLPGDMESERRINVVSAETGVMDALFDTGSIFFNVYTVPGEGVSARNLQASLGHADDVGAGYLLVLNPGQQNVGWELRTVADGALVADGSEGLEDIDPNLDSRYRWIVLGQRIAEAVFRHAR